MATAFEEVPRAPPRRRRPPRLPEAEEVTVEVNGPVERPGQVRSGVKGYRTGRVRQRVDNTIRRTEEVRWTGPVRWGTGQVRTKAGEVAKGLISHTGPAGWAEVDSFRAEK